MDPTGHEFAIGVARYRVGALCGAGGFGSVFHADPLDGTSRRLVVKVPSRGVQANPAFLRRFEREARILGNISHPNVVSTLGVVLGPSSEPMLVQERVENARDLTEFGKSARAEAIASVALQALYGLRAIHGVSAESRAIHRDLSPRNILVDDEEVAKIIDFGLAKEEIRKTAIITETGDTFGTKGCVAPEQLDGARDVDHRVDLYALGRCIGACVLQRRPDFVESSHLPAPWRTVVESLTAYNADDRPRTADDAIDLLMAECIGAGVLPANPQLHFYEFSKWERVTSEWGAMAQRLILQPGRLGLAELALGAMVTGVVAADPRFGATVVFERLDRELFEAEFGSGAAGFDECDPLGCMIACWYPFLSSPAKEKAFRRLCRTAVRYHRYLLMEQVRDVYRGERDEAIRRTLSRILAEEDPGAVIQPRGVLPERDAR